MITDPASAETIKYASNAFLATKLSFINAVAAVCEAVGADVADVVTGMGYDTRIGREFLRPGPGWGGSCFPKDTLAMVRIAADTTVDEGAPTTDEAGAPTAGAEPDDGTATTEATDTGGEGATTTTQFGEASPPEPGLVGSESNAFIPIDYEKSLGCPG